MCCAGNISIVRLQFFVRKEKEEKEKKRKEKKERKEGQKRKLIEKLLLFGSATIITMADIMEKLIEEKVERMNEQIEKMGQEEDKEAQEAQEMTEQRVVMYKEIITFNCILLMKRVMMEHVQFEERVSLMVEVVCRIRQILILYENHRDILVSMDQYEGMVKTLIRKVKQINEVIQQKQQEEEAEGKKEGSEGKKEGMKGKREGKALKTSVHNAFLEVHDEVMSAYEPFNEQPVFK
jgi:hypothetical protein